jgi:hypothetical protein
MREQIAPKVVTETENVEIIKALVRIRMGISIVPYQAVAREVTAGQLAIARIAGHKLFRETGWVHLRSNRLPRAVQEMKRILEQVRPRLKLLSSQAREPDVVRLERGEERIDLVASAARLRVLLPEAGAGLLCAQHDDVQPPPGRDLIAVDGTSRQSGVHRVEEEDRRVRGDLLAMQDRSEHDALGLEARGDARERTDRS